LSRKYSRIKSASNFGDDELEDELEDEDELSESLDDEDELSESLDDEDELSESLDDDELAMIDVEILKSL
jgi:hypothetical protein